MSSALPFRFCAAAIRASRVVGNIASNCGLLLVVACAASGAACSGKSSSNPNPTSPSGPGSGGLQRSVPNLSDGCVSVDGIVRHHSERVAHGHV